MEYSLERKGKGFLSEDSPDDSLQGKEALSTMYYGLIGLFGMLLTGYMMSFRDFIATNYFASLSPILLSGVDAILFSSLMAISEEMLFRGFILDALIRWIKGHPYFPIAINSAIFTVYHLARYGLSYNLLYILAGGFILAWITWRTRRLGPAIIAHTLNNIIATIMAGMV